MNKIDWYSDYDKHDNTIWEGASPYNSDEETFYWRIKPKLRADKIVWVLRSDFELMLDGDKEEEFSTLAKAQKYCQEQHDQIIEDYQQDMGRVN